MFEEVGTVLGAGNSNIPQYYTFLDKEPYTGINYYRLLQFDFDGKSERSHIIKIVTENNSLGFDYEYYLSDDIITLFSENLEFEPTSIQIIDMTGRILYSQTNILDEHNAETTISLDKFVPGVYLISVRQNFEVKTKKIIIY